MYNNNLFVAWYTYNIIHGHDCLKVIIGCRQSASRKSHVVYEKKKLKKYRTFLA